MLWNLLSFCPQKYLTLPSYGSKDNLQQVLLRNIQVKEQTISNTDDGSCRDSNSPVVYFTCFLHHISITLQHRRAPASSELLINEQTSSVLFYS